MKKTFVLLILVLLSVSAKAQMSRWIIKPVFDRIYIQPGAPLIISDSLNTSTIWSITGEKLSVTDDFIHPFKEDAAITTRRKTNTITGFYNLKGEFTRVDNGLTVTYDYPYFRNNILLAKLGGKYCIVNRKGKELLLNEYIDVYPFNKGIATCFTYGQLEKFKDPHYTYIGTNGKRKVMSYMGNVFEDKDVQFLSSINDEGIGVAIIQNKAYLYYAETDKLEQVFSNMNEVNIKNEFNPKKQVRVEIDPMGLRMNGKDSLVILGTGTKIKGKSYQMVKFVLDKFLRPTRIEYADRKVDYKEKIEEEMEFTSPFSSFKSDNKYGLNYNGRMVLPAQFNEVAFSINDFSVVKTSENKWGMLTYNEDLSFKLIMHNGNNIAFRHKEVTTTVKLILPTIISADKCRFTVDEEYGCVIDKISRETKNTENGNFVQYDCTLSIPESLPDYVTEIQYPVQIVYDGIKYPLAQIKTKAWHLKYIDVDLENSETTLEDGANVSFTIKLDISKLLGEDDYPFKVGIQADSLQTELIKISETRYKCKVFSLVDGVNNVSIDIYEDGCPPSIFPFEITYTKPVEKTRTTKEVKEDVKIEKKVKQYEKQEGPILPI